MKKLLIGLMILGTFSAYASNAECEKIESSTYRALCYVKANKTFLKSFKDGFNFLHKGVLAELSRCSYNVDRGANTAAGFCIDDVDMNNDETCLLRLVRTKRLADKYNRIYKDFSIGGFRLQFQVDEKSCLE